MLKTGPALRLIDQAIIDYFTQAFIALGWHFERLPMVAYHACDVRDRSTLEWNVKREHLPQDHSK